MSDCDYRGKPALGGSAGNGEGESLSFILPGGFPPGVNKLYDINHLSRSVRLTDQAALWKTRAIPFVKPCRWPDDWLLRLVLVYESDRWVSKNGKLRRIDLDGFLKLTIDTMFSKWGWDDARLVEITSSKAYGPREQIRVTLERMEVRLHGNPTN
jgi:hypothetical protein